MECPRCKSSTVRHLGTLETCMNVDVHWKDGIKHIHNPNQRTARYACSNGHLFEYVGYKKCPACDYNAEKKIELLIR